MSYGKVICPECIEEQSIEFEVKPGLNLATCGNCGGNSI